LLLTHGIFGLDEGIVDRYNFNLVMFDTASWSVMHFPGQHKDSSRVAVDLGAVSYSDSKFERTGTYDTANATEAVDSDLGRHGEELIGI
jgi:hypothetical protein